MNSNMKLARLAGLLYLVLIICGVFAEFFVRSKIIVWEDAAMTAANIKDNEFLFRLGFASDAVMLIAYLLLPLVLYSLLKSVNQFYALLMVSCVVVCVGIYGTNLLSHYAPLLLLSGDNYLSAFGTDQLNGLVMFFLDLHSHGYMVAQIFFGLYLFPLGYLVYKSRFFPRVLGALLMIGSFGHLMDFFVYYIFPNYESIITSNLTLPGDIAEFSFCIWLLIIGAKQKTL